MRVRIHRGAHQIGGNCIEVAEGDDRIVLDLGRPLSADWNEEVPLPDIPGLASAHPRTHGVVLSHPHLDHYGLAGQLGDDIPIYLGAEASRILDAASFFSDASRRPAVTGHLHDRSPIHLGPFVVTPFLVDHSAFDAYSLLVESGGRRLFYTADVRGHGRKSALFDRLVQCPPRADVLIMEGTNVRPASEPAPRRTETDVENDFVGTFRSTGGLVAAFSSAQNLDRLVTVFRAARRAGRTLVVDLYTATIAQATGRASIPQPGFDGLAVYVPHRQRVRVARTKEFQRVSSIADIRMYPEDLATDRGRVAYLGTSSTGRELVDAGALQGGAVVWSLWPGYLDQPSGRRLTELLQEADVPLVHHHTSGHAHVEDLERLVAAFDPARVVPIHSEATERFSDHFPRVERHDDLEWWEV